MERMENGFFRLGRFGGAPVRVHWSAPVAVVLFSLLLNGFRFAPWAWGALVVLVLAHELGHAALVRAFRLHLASVDVHGLGGACNYYGTPTPIRRALVAWGGVFGQAVLLVLALPALFLLPLGTPLWVREVVSVLIYSNLYLMAINLLPVPGLDGGEAWKLFGPNGLPAWWRQRRLRKGKGRGVVRSMPVHRKFVPDDILEKTPTDRKRPPPHMLN